MSSSESPTVYVGVDPAKLNPTKPWAVKHPPRNRPGDNPESSAWHREMNKMIGRRVTVTQYVGTNHEGLPLYLDHIGVCIALQFQQLSIVLATDDEKIVLKNVAVIRRVRSKNNAPKPPADPDAPIKELTRATETLSDVLGEALKGAPE